MIVRAAGEGDILNAEKFFTEYAESGCDFSFEDITQSVAGMISADSGIIVEHEGQAIAGVAGMFTWSYAHRCKVYFVMFLYVLKAFRSHFKAILRALREYLKPFASGMILASPHDGREEKRARFYKGMGFSPIETHFMWGL